MALPLVTDRISRIFSIVGHFLRRQFLRVFKFSFMTFPFNFIRSFSNPSNIAHGPNPLDGEGRFNRFSAHAPHSALPNGGTLTQAELQRLVAEMVG
ncbi:hypothetical protein [Novosphingobium sp.]|uniref:hypothetical protein n=1 Tax=Novosphingobium sp. TaxID=1874826 RepID=UPI003B5245B3